ncbi:MAG: glycoside hydrolase family 97 protein [Salinivirgaceae bacterium]|nr:glycoside hydrolase family 97 protein [Salinivirgaceae bacterium]
MNRFVLTLSCIVIILFISCTQNKNIEVISPDGKLKVELGLTANEEIFYKVFFNQNTVINPSKLGFDFLDQESILKDLKIVKINKKSFEDSWEMPWGEKREVINSYNSVQISLQEKKAPNRKFDIVFKVYNDGLGFRYQFPEQVNMSDVFITEENTEFNLTHDHKVFWIPGDWDIYEHLYNTTKFSEIDATKYRNHKALAQTSIPNNAVNTPVTMVTNNGIHLSFHEANLTNYSGMTLIVDTVNLKMTSCLVGSDNRDYKVVQKTPFETPWRTIQISESAGGLIESDLIINLNEPNKLGDVSWFKPTKYVGIWWDMHLGRKSWDKASENHGATTRYAKDLIDFASEHNIGGLLVEGWNTGWEHWIGFEDREGVFDFVTPYSDYNLEEVVNYGKEKGVELIMHHETSAATKTYDQQMDSAYHLMQSLGIHSVKTGYVGKILPKGEYHHGQYMVNHYRRALTTAAKYQVAINAHEPIKATGIRRTYPNAISREGLRGQEFNAWSPDGGNPPEHLPIVAFTRMLAGPIDFTPGIFNIKLKPYKEKNQVNTTIAHQLALYVVINSPIQMAADLIEYYKNNPAFQFIEDVPVSWETTKVLNGEVGDFVAIARKDRASENWFVGAISDENERELEINFDFLDKNKTYNAIFYKDGKDAHWNNNPTDYKIETKKITSTSIEKIKLAAGGGFAISLIVNE